MKFFPFLSGCPGRPRHARFAIVATSLCTALALLNTLRAVDVPANDDCQVIDCQNFILKYRTGWKVAADDPDYKAGSHFTINGPGNKNSYVTFDIADKTTDPVQLLSSTLKSLDGTAIDATTKSKIDTWGQFKGAGMDLKGKILATYPGGIRIFAFNSGHRSVLIIECYWADELKNLQPDLDYMLQNFVVKS